MPLAEQMRPKAIDDVVGQKHLLQKGRLLRSIIDNKAPVNMVFYGPPGTGKTTVANIIAENSGLKFHKLNAITASLSDIKDALKNKKPQDPPVLLYLDEIQYFNKKQQQSLLEVTEKGEVQLITSTTENPYFCIYGALLSRSSVFEFKPITAEDILPAVQKALALCRQNKNFNYEPSVPERIALAAGGDARKAISLVELLVSAIPDGDTIMSSALDQVSANNSMRYDRYGDQTYDLASGLHKSIRGSDPSAAMHYLARFLAAGDLITPCRRILCAACEDIGLANPIAPVIAKTCVDMANALGLPEARIPLAHAVLYLATCPKSNSVEQAIDAAMKDVNDGHVGSIPRNLQNVHADSTGQKQAQNYLYPHNYPLNWVPQQYMPDDLIDKKYYAPGSNQNEQAIVQYWTNIYNQYRQMTENH